MIHESAAGTRIAPVEAGQLESFLPVIEDYQRFYRVKQIERGQNRGFFGRLIAPSRHGLLIGAWQGGEPVGYGCLHWTLDSVQARETATLHDLYVRVAYRGEGIGRGLIATAVKHAQSRRSDALVWEAGPDNETALRLYESTGASSSAWIHYELSL